MTRVWAKAVWVAAVAASWSLVAVGAVDNFFIEGTSSALAQARVGQHRAAAGALLLLSLGIAVPLMRPRFWRTATALVVGSAVVVLLTSTSDAVLFTGLLSGVPVLLGVVLALVPERGATMEP